MEIPARRFAVISNFSIINWCVVLCIAVWIVWYSTLQEMTASSKIKVDLIKVSDGDTIRVTEQDDPTKKHSVRFAYIDAPEMKQPFGPEARQRLIAKFEESSRRQLSLQIIPAKDRWGRTLAVIYFGKENINLWLVKEGLAWAYVKLSCPVEYKTAQAEAEKGKVGLWSAKAHVGATPEPPWEFRKAVIAARKTAKAVAGGGDTRSRRRGGGAKAGQKRSAPSSSSSVRGVKKAAKKDNEISCTVQ